MLCPKIWKAKRAANIFLIDIQQNEWEKGHQETMNNFILLSGLLFTLYCKHDQKLREAAASFVSQFPCVSSSCYLDFISTSGKLRSNTRFKSPMNTYALYSWGAVTRSSQLRFIESEWKRNRKPWKLKAGTQELSVKPNSPFAHSDLQLFPS